MDDERLAQIREVAEAMWWSPAAQRMLAECLAEIARLRRELADECMESARLRELVGDADDGMHG